MIFTETKLKGAYIIELQPIEDNRGYFARTWCQKEFRKNEIKTDFVQQNISVNNKTGTLRGMHLQVSPYEEAKLIKCVNGSIYDVIVDLRPDSSTYMQWLSIVLSNTNHKMIYVPRGFAHGFQTLEDNSMVLYQMSEYYHPQYSSGFRWNDPSFNIHWPIPITVISEKDSSYNNYFMDQINGNY